MCAKSIKINYSQGTYSKGGARKKKGGGGAKMC
jgi:hypothetical protein